MKHLKSYSLNEGKNPAAAEWYIAVKDNDDLGVYKGAFWKKSGKGFVNGFEDKLTAEQGKELLKKYDTAWFKTAKISVCSLADSADLDGTASLRDGLKKFGLFVYDAAEVAGDPWNVVISNVKLTKEQVDFANEVL